MRPGVRLGLDPGDARIGVARSDPSGFLATPVETVQRGRGDLARIAEIVVEEEAVEVVVGLPRSLSGRRGSGRRQGARVRGPAGPAGRAGAGAAVRRAADHRVRGGYAARPWPQGGKRRAVVDQAAAVVILQHALDTERDAGDRARREIVEESHE